MFFEAKHSLLENEFVFFEGTEISFPVHMHRSFEYFEQRQGSTEVTVGNRHYLLREGESVLIFPLQPHSYREIESGSLRICIFSPELVRSFYDKTAHKLPTDHQFCCVLPNPISCDTFFHKKALAYLICGEFERGREYTEYKQKSEDRLLVSLLHFADRNFCSRCLLRDAAKSAGYDYVYVSKFFKRRVGMSFRRYVNNLRIIESKQLLSATTAGIEEIGERCGFCSLRAFDREFREQEGMTPSEYRLAHKSGS